MLNEFVQGMKLFRFWFMTVKSSSALFKTNQVEF